MNGLKEKIIYWKVGVDLMINNIMPQIKIALDWWNKLSPNKQTTLNIKYFGQFDMSEDNSLTPKEIEMIYKKEK
jgi:hypothetical protein